MSLSNEIIEQNLFHLLLNLKKYSKREKSEKETKKYLKVFINHKLGYELNDEQIKYFLYRLKKKNILGKHRDKIIWKSNKSLDNIIEDL